MKKKDNNDKPSLHVMLPLVLVRSVIGFSVGLYLYNYGPIIRDQFAKHAGSVAFLGLNPLQWTAAVFCCGILMEVLLEVPTGVVGDEFGRKLAVILSLVFRIAYFAALMMLCFAPNIYWVIAFALLAVFAFAISYTLYSGTFVAWVNDALEEEGKAEKLSWALAYAQVFYWASFLVGCLVGIFLWRSAVVFISYFCGAGICLACALICMIYMKENEGYEFSSWRAAFSPGRWRLISRYSGILKVGTRIFWSSRTLIILFLVQATALSLVYVVDFTWPIFVEQRFVRVLQGRFSLEWIGLIIAFTVPILLGSIVIERWLKKRRHRHRLGQLTTAMYALFCLPIFLVAWLTSSDSETTGLFWLFVGVMAIHKFFHGTIDAPMEALQNQCIGEHTQERATALSWGTLVRGLPISILAFVGVGSNAGSLIWWLVPATAVTLATIVLAVLSFRSGGREVDETVGVD